jgi:hypothetical protein
VNQRPCTAAPLNRTMTYKFKSKSTGDLIMLDADARRLLQIIGKDPGPTGILLPEQIAAAVQALEAAIDREAAEHGALPEQAEDKAAAAPGLDQVSLRQCAGPLIDMLGRCAKDRAEMVWGV